VPYALSTDTEIQRYRDADRCREIQREEGVCCALIYTIDAVDNIYSMNT
jgi:hypothetical protein